MMARESVRLGLTLSVKRPTVDALAAPATPRSPKSPATCAPMFKGGPLRRNERVVQKALKAPNIIAETTEASLKMGCEWMTVRRDRIRAKYPIALSGRERGKNMIKATARRTSIKAASR